MKTKFLQTVAFLLALALAFIPTAALAEAEKIKEYYLRTYYFPPY